MMSNFFDENDHALKSNLVVLRDSLGALAVSILSADPDFTKMNNRERLSRLYSLINDLQKEYERANGDFD